uniref:Zn(2)-C6 fungal-type domain-containing protein n=1 Tax=Mycena chlorophos TaxID=658473 RepID=A0ABQ0LBE3_MYCCL|nr:predicted protein [Mycena chlorophos]
MSVSSRHSSPDNAKLQRGQACFNCRRRKRKCDGMLPCGQCTRLGAEDACEYTDPTKRPTVDILQEHIDELQTRIYQLERPRTGSSHSRHSSASSHVVDSSSSSPRGRGGSTGNLPRLTLPNDPPSAVIADLVDTFLINGTEFGFFLNASRFREGALRPLPFGDFSRPTPALLSAVYLWAIHLSTANSPIHSPASSSSSGSSGHMLLPRPHPDEAAYLARALSLTSKGLFSAHPHRVLHTLQAEILLAYYFYMNERIVEAKYHAAAAVSLSLSSGLHQIRSVDSTLPPPIDGIHQGEYVRAWWAVFVLDACFAVGLLEPLGINIAAVDTPWPLDGDEYALDASSQTITAFLSGHDSLIVGLSTTALVAKTALLYQKADELARTSTGPTRELQQLYALVDAFRNALPSPTTLARPPTPTSTRELVVAHSLAHAAAVRIHGLYALTDPSAKITRLAAARSVLGIIAAVPMKHLRWINPIMASVWVSASRVFLEEIASVQARYQGAATLSEEEVNLRTFLVRAGPPLRTFERNCLLMQTQLGQTLEAFTRAGVNI